MLGRKSRPEIGKLTGALGSGNRVIPGFSDVATSPRSPLELRIQSPRGLNKNYDLGGVGLGIVAALERCSDVSSIQVKKASGVIGLNLNRCSPIRVNSDNKCARVGVGIEEMDTDSSFEDYTYVTCHGPNNSSYTRVYFSDGVNQYVTSEHPTNNLGVHNFHISPSPAIFEEDMTAFPTSDFLSSCHLCRKELHGKDIYMYRGEKAFCSTECRYRQIVVDEKKEQQQFSSCERSSTSTSTSTDISNSPCTTNGPIFSTGILAI